MPPSNRSLRQVSQTRRLNELKAQNKENSPPAGVSVPKSRSRNTRRTDALLVAEQHIESLEAELLSLGTSLEKATSCSREATVVIRDLQAALDISEVKLKDSLDLGNATMLRIKRAQKRIESQRKCLLRARKREALLLSHKATLRDDLARARDTILVMHADIASTQADATRTRADAVLAFERAALAEAQLLAATELTKTTSASVLVLSEKTEVLTKALDATQRQVAISEKTLEGCQRKLKASQMCHLRAVRARDKAKERARAALAHCRQTATWKLTRGRTYSPEARNAARLLQRAGCSQAAVGPTIVALARIFGISVNRTMSRRTAQRASIEGGMAAKMQLAYEISKCQGFTASGDGTSHRKITYEAWHVNLLAPSYDDPSAAPSHRTRLVSVDQALDHTSETQVAGWKEHANDMSELLNASPLAQREGVEFQPDDFARKIKGMHGDHASDQLKTARAIEAWKALVMHMDLGWARMSEMPSEELDRISAEAIAKKVEAVSENAWLLLDDSGQRQHIRDALSALALELGVLSLADLPMEDQRELTFFVRGGCCMHKDLNSVKGGNDAMQAEWSKLEAQAPILLANKANAATIEASSASDPAARLAIDASTRGGVKLTSLAGAIFNNKDDKKGHQDVHRWYFEKVKRGLDDSKAVSVKFPSTSNTRFQSHCRAAGELVTYCKEYVEFLEYTRDNKEKRNFNHIELNVYNGLHDKATITELAVLVLYAQMITHPYMHAVRGPGVESVNLLDLGPLHRDLRSHIAYIIDHPEILLESPEDEIWKKASLDKQPWEDPKAIKAVFSLQPELPHLKPLLIAFLKGALETWNRFSAEFDPDGLIDTASPSEKILAHMPSTNDPNEGALGAMRVSARQNPNETAQNHSARATFNRNDTQSFMDAKFEYSDHLYIMQAACRTDASQAPKMFRDQLMERLCATVQKKRTNDEIRASKKNGLLEKLLATELVQDEAALKRMSVKELDLQLEVYRVVLKDPEVPIKARLKNKKEKYAALVAAVARSKVSSQNSATDLPSETGEITRTNKDVLLDEDDDDDVLYYQK